MGVGLRKSRWAIGALMLLAHVPLGALDSQRRLDQLFHSAWTIKDGAPPDIWALAQSHDGYLWLGTGAGLYRFDGVRFEKVRLAPGNRMPSANINALYVDPAGDLWIGFEAGQVARLRNGGLTTFSFGARNAAVLQIAGGRNNGIWAALKTRDRGGLARFLAGRWSFIGDEAGLPAGAVSSVVVARDGSVWTTTAGWLWVLRPEAQRFERTVEPAAARARIFEARDGRIWLSPGGSRPIHAIAGSLQPAGLKSAPPSGVPSSVEPSGEPMLIDRDGVLWAARAAGGIFRVIGNDRPPASRSLERFTLKNGLSSDIASPLLEDREGNIWVGTNLGLDRFREANAVAAPGLPPTSRKGFQIAAGKDGAVYVLTGETLFEAHANRAAQPIAHYRGWPRSLHVDRSNALWAGFDDGIARLAGSHFRFAALPRDAQGTVTGWLESADLLCAAVLEHGIFCRYPSGWRRAPPPLGAQRRAPVQMLSDARGRVWLNYVDHLVMLDENRQIAASEENGLAAGRIELVTSIGEQIYILGDFGLARFDGRRFQTLRAERHPRLSRLSGMVLGSDGAVWLNGISGVTRVAVADLAAAFVHPERELRSTLFDLDDGLPGVAQQDSNTPTAIEAQDHRLWFVTSHGIAWIDPQHLSKNALVPPVSINRLVAGGRSFATGAPIHLPAGTTGVQIDYAALSLSIPERVRFRYRLEGVDAAWVDPGHRRQAFYTGLGPGHYRFQVIAANNDGVWNRSGATVSFDILPTLWQSIWFKVLIAIAFIAGGWLLYSLRMRQVASTIRQQVEGRLRERERIARELHDTLLQGFQGLIYRFQSAIDTLPPSHGARANLEEALDRADAALAEGRDSVRNLRTTSTSDNIAQHFADTAAQAGTASSATFHVVTEGPPRRLCPPVHAEILRIGDEAILNALRHSKAQKIIVNIIYHKREFLLQIADNGIGIAPEVAAGGGRPDHFGMTGMRERAEVVRGKFSIASRPGGGTQVTLTVPASIAYEQRSGLSSRFAHRRWLIED